ncbi:MAG: hypothetical protein AAB738_00565 [Patescibacteria group bacterium]
MKNNKGFANIAVVILVVVIAAGLGYFAFKNKTQNPPESKIECGGISGIACPAGYTCITNPKIADSIGYCKKEVFKTQGDCETKTGKPCHNQACDYVPPGKTFEEVCGKDFKKGWVPILNATDICAKEKENIVNVVKTFEDLQTKRDSLGILKLFTQPRNPGDSVSYESLLGSDAAGPRLYNTGLTNFMQSSYKILEQSSGNESGSCAVKVEEQRSYQAHGIGSELSPSPSIPYIAYIVLAKENNEWKIDSYLSDDGNTHKFSGWGY